MKKWLKSIMTKKQLYLPLIISISYIFITFIFSIIGPVEYIKYGYNYLQVGSYLFFIIICITIGYYFGIKSKKRNKYVVKKNRKKNPKIKIHKLIKVSLFISIIMLILEIYYLSVNYGFSFNVKNITESYFSEIAGNNPIMILKFILHFFNISSCCLGIYYYSNLTIKYKIFVILVLFFTIIVSVFGYGQQREVGNVMIYIMVFIITRNVYYGKKLSFNTKIIIGLSLIVFFLLLSYIQYMRYEYLGVNVYNYHLRSTGDFKFNPNHLIFKLFGYKIAFGFSIIFTLYLSMGYYGLYLTLQLPFQWSYGVGFSRSLMLLLERYFDLDIYSKTYLSRLSLYGRDGLAVWNTIFPWLASDMTFYGAGILFLIIGYILSKSWREVILENNAISYLMLNKLVLLVLFIPANNQIFHSYGALTSSIIILLLWVFFRSDYSYINGEKNEE